YSLHLRRQWSDVIDPRDGQQFARLLKADLSFTTRHDGAHALAIDALALRAHLVGDAEPLKQLSRDVNPADLRGIGNRLGLQQRALERIQRADIRFWCPRAYGHADARTRERHA